jgi:hypothetical protein
MADFAEQVKLWRECLAGQDSNSIFSQITLLTWDAAIFRMLLEARRSQIEQNPTDPAVNGRLHSFIDRNFFQSQAASIRRLLDRHGSLTGRRGVYSLGALVADMRENRAAFTRERFLANLGLPYDYAPIKAREEAFMLEQAKARATAFRVLPELDWENPAQAHQIFDRLSGKTAPQRKPEDTIVDKIFARLQEKLDTCHDVTQYVDKYIAHAATPQSRAADSVDSSRVTWGHIHQAHELIYEVAEYLGKVLTSMSNIPLPFEGADLFEHLDAPLVGTEDLPRLAKAWDDYRTETEKWRLEGENRLQQWVES